MSDPGFKIPPSERREPRRFEPPPWEQEAFATREVEAQGVPEHSEGPAETEAVSPDEPGLPPEPPAVEGEQDQGQQPGPAAGEGVEDARVAEMLAELAASEPRVERGFHVVGLASAILLVAAGAVLVIWGVAALMAARSTGPVGLFGGSVIGLFGIGFIGGGLWLAVRTLRQRGVL